MNKSSTQLVMFQNTAISVSLYRLLDLLFPKGKTLDYEGNMHSSTSISYGWAKALSGILVQQALYFTQENMFRQFTVLEECAADKTEPLRREKHHKKIHQIQATNIISCNFRSQSIFQQLQIYACGLLLILAYITIFSTS